MDENLIYSSRDGEKFQLISLPFPKYILKITDDFEVHLYKQPNWWFRMWQYLLLGWKWKKNVK